MKKILGLLAGALLMLGPASAYPMPVYIYSASLSGANEASPNASPGWGSVTVIPYAIVHKFKIVVSFTGLAGTTTASHIHCCVADPGTAGVATQLPSFLTFPLGVTSGTWSQIFDEGMPSTYSPAFLAANGGNPYVAWNTLLTALGSDMAYYNIHTSAYPGGEIRGFFQTVAVDNFPEPATLALLGAGLLGAFGARRRIKKS